MNEPIDLAAARRAREPHATGQARCLDCEHEWVAVIRLEAGSVWIECPACSLYRGRMVGQFEREDESHWNCACGNDLFYVTPDGSYCPNCGAWQVFDERS